MICYNQLMRKLNKTRVSYLGFLIVLLLISSLTMAQRVEAVTDCTDYEGIQDGSQCAADYDTYLQRAECLQCVTESVYSVDPAGTALDLINAVANYFVAFVLLVGLIMIIKAGFDFVSGGDDPAKLTNARKLIIWAAVGIASAILARAIVALVISIVTTGGFTGGGGGGI